MASVEFEGPAGGGTLAKPAGKKDKYGFEGPVAVSEGQAVPDMGHLEAAGRGAIHGATLGLEGYLAAAGLMEAQGLTGEDLGGGDQAQILKEQRRIAEERIKEARAAHPYTTGAAEFAGGMAAPIPVPRGAGLLGRMGIGAGTGAAIGGISSFGGAENPTVPQFLLSTGAGAVTGGALPAATAPLGYAARAAAQRFGIDRLPIFRNVEHEAASEVSRSRQEALAIEREAQARATAEGRSYEPQVLDPSQMTPGGPAMTMDVLGAPGRAVARGAADISPRAQATLEEPLYARRDTQEQRLRELVSPELAYAQRGQQKEALARPSAETNQAYREAREIGDGRIQLTAPLQTLAQTRVVQAAFRHVQSDLEDKHRMDTLLRQQQGLPPRNAPSLNDLATWDLVKRRLDDLAGAAFKNLNNTRGGVLADAARMLRGAIDEQVPEYAGARASARAEILARNAFKEGGDFLTKGDTYETQQALARLATQAPQAVETFRQGFMHAMLAKAHGKPTEGNLLAQIKATPEGTDRMTIALGQPMVQRLEQQRETERIMQQGLQAVTGQSQTARFLQRQGRNIGVGAGALTLGGAAMGADELLDIGHKLHAGSGGAALVLATTALSRHMDARVAERIAQMLVSRDPNQMQRLSQLAATSPPLQQALTLLRDNVVAPALTRGTAGAAARAVAP